MTDSRPQNEVARQQELATYHVLDTAPDSAIDSLVALAAEICEVPIALVSLVDEDRQWFKSKIGLTSTQTPRDQAFCAHAILKPHEMMVVPDAAEDARFAANPMVTGNPHIRFYAGNPLVTANGHGLGTLCIMDLQPRQLRPFQQRALRVLSEQVVQLLELHRERAVAEQQRKFMGTVSETIAEGVIVRNRERTLVFHNHMASLLLGIELEDIVGKPFTMMDLNPIQLNGEPLPVEDLPSNKALATGEAQRNYVFGITRPNKTQVWLEANASVLLDPDHGECAVISFRDITDRRKLEQQLQIEATSDPLTGLLNRRGFLGYVERAIAAATRHKHPMCLCLGDLDRLKYINDTFGHAAGDAALRHFAKVLRMTLRHEDTAARIGGDEFVALFPYVCANQAATSLDRFRRSLANGRLRLQDGKEISISGSFGVTDWKPGMTVEDLLAAADKVLYEAKAQGKNRVAVSS